MARKQKQISTDASQVETLPIVVKPLVQGEKKHLLAQLFEGNSPELPILKSVGFGRIEANGSWISYVIRSRGKEIISIEVSDPDQRSIAEDNAKTSFVTELVDQGL